MAKNSKDLLILGVLASISIVAFMAVVIRMSALQNVSDMYLESFATANARPGIEVTRQVTVTVEVPVTVTPGPTNTPTVWEIEQKMWESLDVVFQATNAITATGIEDSETITIGIWQLSAGTLMDGSKSLTMYHYEGAASIQFSILCGEYMCRWGVPTEMWSVDMDAPWPVTWWVKIGSNSPVYIKFDGQGFSYSQ